MDKYKNLSWDVKSEEISLV